MPETTASFLVDRFDRKAFPAAPIFLQPGTPEVLRVEAKQDGRAKEASKCQPAAEETRGETRTIVLRPQTVACGDCCKVSESERKLIAEVEAAFEEKHIGA